MSLRILFGLASVLILGLTAASFVDEFTASWADYQREYNRLLAARVSDPKVQEALLAKWPTFEQIYNPELGIVDRCILCHRGIDTPAMADAPQPHRSHPGDLLKHHPVQTFGCTVCHQGQGRATERNAAWGHVPHWEKPLLKGEFIQASCTRCHEGDSIPGAPTLSAGKRMLRTMGCLGCHEVGGATPDDPRVAPDLSGVGSKVTRRWLKRWLEDPHSLQPAPRMPDFRLRRGEVQALTAYLMTLREPAIDEADDVPEGDYDRGEQLYKTLQCIDCHVTKFRRDGTPVGGDMGPALVAVATKTNRKWLYAWLKETHEIQPRTRMPHFGLDDQQAADLVGFIAEEWIDPDVEDDVLDGPEPTVTEEERALVPVGEQLFRYYGCAGCHGWNGAPSKTRIGPELTYVGSKDLHKFDFGEAEVRHTRPDFLFAKMKDPRTFGRGLELPQHPLAAGEVLQRIWERLTPQPLFSGRQALPGGSVEFRTRWILERAQAEGVIDTPRTPPPMDASSRVRWLQEELEGAGAFNLLKMPDFGFSDDEARALTIALMSLSEERPPSEKYMARASTPARFEPRGRVGELIDQYRCLSCHSIGDRGQALAADLSFEGSKVRRDWLYEFLRRPYSMRRTLTVAMPRFGYSDEDAALLADYLSMVTVHPGIPDTLDPPLSASEAEEGRALFSAKGCHACHQTPEGGGDVGPSLSTQVPDYPVDTWAGDKLREGWVYQWLKDPHALLADAIEPRFDLSVAERRALTAHVMSLKRSRYVEGSTPDGGTR